MSPADVRGPRDTSLYAAAFREYGLDLNAMGRGDIEFCAYRVIQDPLLAMVGPSFSLPMVQLVVNRDAVVGYVDRGLSDIPRSLSARRPYRATRSLKK